MRDITIEEALRIKDRLFVDVRSPGEFTEATIPGAINVPLLDNEERARVGTVYRHQGPEDAKELGLEYVSPKFPGMMKRIKQLSSQYTVVVFCWRGGLRSKTVCEMSKIMGLTVLRLVGGYKAYRRYVNDFLNRPSLPGRAVVLHGLTGVGKTDILNLLENLDVGVLDLEAMANNRGSVFGSIGLGEQPSQKMFESRIVEVLSSPKCGAAFAVECESRRIGRLSLPDLLLNSMTGGSHILLYASMEKRIERLVNMYAGNPNNVVGLHKGIDSLTKRLGKNKAEELKAMVTRGDYAPFMEYLLVNYYDPLYRYPEGPSEQYPLSVCTDNPKTAALKIAEFMRELVAQIGASPVVVQ